MTLKKTGKRYLAIGLALILTFTSLWTGGWVEKVYADGDWIGITDSDGLKNIENNLSGNYKLMSDIDLTGNWTPLGTFTGKLDGNGKVIRNLIISNTTLTGAGLFTVVGAGAQIYNLGIEGANITAGDNTGILAGINHGAISKVYAKGSISGQNNVGGLVGSSTAAIDNSFASASVSGRDKVGGLVGANSGTVNQTYTASEVEASVFSNYLEFDGTSGYISIPHHADYVTGTFTLEAWFQWDDVTKPEDTNPHDYVDFIIGKGVEKFEIHTEGGSGRNGIRFIPIPNENLNGDSYLDIENVLQPGWFHVAASYSYNADSQTASASFFINGVAQDIVQNGTNVGKTATMNRTTAPSMGTADIYIGMRTNGIYNFKGKIADVRFWNIVRTEEQIAADKDKKLTGSEEGLVGYWKLDEASGPAIDSTSRGNNGTLNGGITRTQTETSNKGGLVGENTGTVSNSYYDSDISEQSDTGKGEPKTTEAMNLEGTFNTWDFGAIWGIDTEINEGYPYLLSTSKDITSFSFTGLDPVVAGVVDESTKTIALTVPFGTDVTALAPVIEHTGASISPDSGEQQDFSDPVTYTVTAANQSTQNYLVTVTVSPQDFPGGEGSLSSPYGVAVDSSGNIYVANQGNDTITKMNSSGAIDGTFTSPPGLFGPTGVAVDSSGNIYIANKWGNSITKIDSNGAIDGTFTSPSGLDAPTGVAVDNSGNIYVACEGSGQVKKMNSTSGAIDSTFTSEPDLTSPAGVAVDSSGYIYIADTMSNSVIKMDSGGAADDTFTSLLPSYDYYPVGAAVDSSDNLYVSYQDYNSGLGDVIKMNNNTGDIVDTYNGFINPQGVAVDSSGNIYVAEAADATIKKISADTTAPTISSVVASPTSATNGDVTVTVSATDASGIAATGGYSFDGGTSWQDGNSRTYSSNTTIASGSIKVKDTVGNIASYGTQIDITNIDTTPPILTSGVVSRTSDMNGTVKFTSDKTGEYYYEIVDDGGPTPDINTTGSGTACSAGETIITLTGLSAGAKDIYIIVKDAAGNVSNVLKIDIDAYSNPVAAPGAPVLQSAVAGDGHVNISWSSVSGSTGYKIFSSITSGNYGDPLATVTDSVYSYNVTGLENGTTYYFAVKATNPGGDSSNSNELSATPQVAAPGAPVLQSAVAGDEHVNISWSSVSGSTGYKIFSSITSGDYGDPLATVTDSVYSYNVTGLENGTTYYFAVSATNPGGDSGYSNEISATPMSVPEAPTDVTAEAGNGQATVSFTVPEDDGGSPMTGYVVTSNPGGITAFGAGTPITVTGLANGTAYTFTVKAVNAVGNGEESEASNVVIPYRPSRRDNTEDENTPATPIEPTKPSEAGVEILVNGRTETAATSTTITSGDKTVTTVTLDDKKVEEKLQTEGNNAVVTIPVKNTADVVIGELNGQTVKNMEVKEAVLEIKTENATYTLPAAQISIDNVSTQLGEQVELKDIAVNVSISAPPQDTVRIIEDTANRNNYQVVVKPVEFNITCISGNKTVEVSKFNGYVERMIAVPEGIDPGKITTGIVLNPDGTFSHVPTSITIIDGKYYAKINSLTNSTYSVIWSLKTFKDVETHWAKNDVNDMGSRLVIDGVGDGRLEPNRDVTRAEFAAIVVKALGLMRPGTGKDAFADVEKTAWYYDAVSIAYEYGNISGYGNGKFGPTDKITREQAMTMIARAMKITGLKVDFKAGEADKLLAEFGDSEQAAAWAKESMAACVKAGVVSGKSGKTLAPKDEITRAEVAVIVRRMLQKSGLI